jgi:toxin YoeB
MRVVFSEHAWEEYVAWQQALPKLVERVSALIREIQRTPFEGIGKPEPLRHALSGYWSRRVTAEHRVVCKVRDDALLIAQLRYHY